MEYLLTGHNPFNQMTNIQDTLLYRDGLILIINKPSGIPVHKGSGGGIVLEDYFDDLKFGLPNPPTLAHRLDKDTSGCLVLARNKAGAVRMSKLFQDDQVEKKYLAVVHGVIPLDEGIIDLPLGKQSSKKNLWWAKVDFENGKPSLTHYKVLKRYDHFTLLCLTPKTGRTHQLRVHCAEIGHPILGDAIYGKKDPVSLHLHAHTIKIPFNPKKPDIMAKAPIPDEWGEFKIESADM